jgi:integrase
MNFLKRLSKKGDKITFYYDYGRKKGQRPSTGIYIYTKPRDQVQKNHNKEALALLEVKKSQLTIEQQAVGSAYIPSHKFKANFLDYYEEYVKTNSRNGNRHLQNSFTQFKTFIKRDFISPLDITENLCKNFRRYLLDKYTGETPSDYYTQFKWVLAAATTDKYYLTNPTAKVSAKSNPSTKLKEHLEVEEYIELLRTPIFNREVKEAFIFCCYTGLRWVDVKGLSRSQVKGLTLTTQIIQQKTGQPVTLTLHPIAKAILNKRRSQLKDPNDPKRLTRPIFTLPSANGANIVLSQWMTAAGIAKHITWSCARLSFSILLKDKLVDDPTIAYLMGILLRNRCKKYIKGTVQKTRQRQLTFYQARNYFRISFSFNFSAAATKREGSPDIIRSRSSFLK